MMFRMSNIVRSAFASVWLVFVLGVSPGSAQLANVGFEQPLGSSFIGNWGGFASSNASFSLSTESPNNGLQHLVLQTVGINQFAGVAQDWASPVNPGDLVTFSGFHRSTGVFTGTREVKFEWFGAAETRIDSSVVSLGAYGAWSESAIAPVGASGVRLAYVISSFNPGAGNNTVFVDDMSASVVPEPSSTFVFSLGLMSLCGLRRRKG